MIAATRSVAAACAIHGVELIHLSSDVVFDGEHAPYAEDAPLVPVHAYGRAKAEAEADVASAVADAAVVRTSLVCATDPLDPRSAWVVDTLRAGDPITLFTDEIRCPVRADDLARMLWDIVALPRAERAGPWHLVGPDALSRHELGVLLAASARLGPGRDHRGEQPGPCGSPSAEPHAPGRAVGRPAHAASFRGDPLALASGAMKISTQLRYDVPPAEVAKQAVDLEAAGLDLIWVAEAYGVDAVSIMGYLAAVTERVEIASGILPLYTRTPTLLAMTAAGVDALSGGRCVLGLGASGPQVIEGFHGVPYDKPLTRTREIIEICRQVWKRERVQYEGKAYTVPLPEGQGTGLGKPLKLITHPVRDRIPIHVAALGPKNVELTAEIADGWLPLFYLPEKAKDVWGDDLAGGAAKRSADLDPLEVVAGGLVAIGKQEEVAGIRDFARPMVALYVGGMGARGKNFYNDLVCRYGFEKEAAEIQDLYLDGKKDEAAAVIPDDLLEATTICGDEGYVKERLAAYRESGVTMLNITPVGDAADIVGKLKDWTS